MTVFRTRRYVAKLCSNHGQTLVEYGLLVGLVALVAVGALFTLGEAVGGPFSEVSDAIADALGGGEGDSL